MVKISQILVLILIIAVVTAAGDVRAAAPITPAQQQACTMATTTAYFDAKVANRVTRYLAILKGIPSYCVQADLGLEPALKDFTAKPVGTEPIGEKGRLLLCSGKAKTDGSCPDFVYRVVLDSDPTKLREVADGRDLPIKTDLPNFDAALIKSGITKPADLKCTNSIQ